MVLSPKIAKLKTDGLRILRRIWGFVPLSGPGLALVLTLLTGTYFLGIKQNDYVLLITGGALLAAALVDAVIVVVTALLLWYAFKSESEKQKSAGGRLELISGVQAPSSRTFSRFLPPLIEASTQILNPPGVDCEWKRNPDQRRQEWLRADRRCLLEENFLLRRRLIVKDVLGIASIDWEQEEPLTLIVHPKPLSMQTQNILRTRFQGDDIPDPRGEPKGDRVDMRRYTPGDPPRLLLWKVYARTGKLMVRVPEAAITTAPRACAYLVAGPEDEILASLARTVVEANLLGQGWRFGADGSERSAENSHDALRLIARSGNPGSEEKRGLSAFLNESASQGFGSCLLFVPPSDADWIESVAAAVSRSPIGITLLTVGSVAQKREQPKWKKWVYYKQGTSIDPSELLARLNSSAVTDWLSFEPETGRLIPLRAQSGGSSR